MRNRFFVLKKYFDFLFSCLITPPLYLFLFISFCLGMMIRFFSKLIRAEMDEY